MPVEFQPPPTWAPIVLEVEEPTTGQKKHTFNPVWLKWFVDIASLLTGAGGGAGSLGDVRGPDSAVDRNIAAFAGTTGKVVEDSGIDVDEVVRGPATAVDGNVAVFDGTTGKLLRDGGGSPVVTSNFADAVVPTGAIDGVNTVFTLPNTPNPVNSLVLYHADGSPYIGGGVHYTFAVIATVPTITFQAAAVPQTGDLLRAYYRY